MSDQSTVYDAAVAMAQTFDNVTVGVAYLAGELAVTPTRAYHHGRQVTATALEKLPPADYAKVAEQLAVTSVAECRRIMREVN